jgi:DNA-binding MarR family transcriptional regulator
MDLGGVTGSLTRLHFAIMGILSRGSMSVTELANTLMMPKSQMTHLIDQLADQGAVERRPDEKDRRVINLSLTEHGRALLDDAKHKVLEKIKEALSGLSKEDLKAMSQALETLKNIGARL